MKIYWLPVVLVMELSIACQKDRFPLTTPTNPACEESTPVIHQARNFKGTIGYREDLALYTVNYYVPGSIDGQWVGLACNLPTSYQVEGKVVEFSGDYRSTQGKVPPRFGGDEMYYLFLSAIE